MNDNVQWLLGKVCLVLLVVMPGAHALEEFECDHEAVPPSTPSSDFTVIEDGSIVHHETTGLEWQRCPMVPTLETETAWNGSDCESQSWATANWVNALQHVEAYVDEYGGDWRMPNINELRSIIEECASDPAYNTIVFPSSVSSMWASTPYAAESGLYWRVFSWWGETGPALYSDNTIGIRLVRDAQ